MLGDRAGHDVDRFYTDNELSVKLASEKTEQFVLKEICWPPIVFHGKMIWNTLENAECYEDVLLSLHSIVAPQSNSPINRTQQIPRTNYMWTQKSESNKHAKLSNWYQK